MFKNASLVYNAAMHPNDTDEMASSVDPDQTALSQTVPEGAV